MEETVLPKFDYHLDESDPDIAVLRRQDGAFVAAFSARGFTKEGIVEAAKEDYRALLEECTRSEIRRPSTSGTLNRATKLSETLLPRRLGE